MGSPSLIQGTRGFPLPVAGVAVDMRASDLSCVDVAVMLAVLRMINCAVFLRNQINMSATARQYFLQSRGSPILFPTYLSDK